MRNFYYLLLDIGAFASAVGVGLWRQQQWLREWQASAQAILLTAIPFLAWDIAATAAGHWWFNPVYTLGLRIFGLPLEEWLFFVAIPLVALSVWELCAPQPTGKTRAFKGAQSVIAATCIAFAVLNTQHAYSIVAAAVALCTALLWLMRPYALKKWLIFQGSMLVLFVCANTVLTILPIVSYNAAHISGVRVGSIPLEDFLYNFALSSLVAYCRDILSHRAHPHEH